MHLVTIERRLADNLRRTLIAVEGWLAENGIERGRLQIHGGTGLGAVAFTVHFDCPLQAGRFADAFPPWLRAGVRHSRHPSRECPDWRHGPPPSRPSSPDATARR